MHACELRTTAPFLICTEFHIYTRTLNMIALGAQQSQVLTAGPPWSSGMRELPCGTCIVPLVHVHDQVSRVFCQSTVNYWIANATVASVMKGAMPISVQKCP